MHLLALASTVDFADMLHLTKAAHNCDELLNINCPHSIIRLQTDIWFTGLYYHNIQSELWTHSIVCNQAYPWACIYQCVTISSQIKYTM